RADRFVACRVADRHFVRIGSGLSFYSGDSNYIGTGLLKLNRREVPYTIRRDIPFPFAHLVHQLLYYSGIGDSASGARVFGDRECPVFACFNDWVTNVPEIGYRLPIALAVSAGALCPAFDDVTGDRTSGESIPVIRRPFELVYHRSQRKPSIGAPTGDDALRSAFESFSNRSRAEVYVRTLNTIANS